MAVYLSYLLIKLYRRFLDGGDKIRFYQLMEKSLNCPGQSEAICQKCEKRARITSTRRVSKLSQLLLIDTSVVTDSEKNFWNVQLQVLL